MTGFSRQIFPANGCLGGLLKRPGYHGLIQASQDSRILESQDYHGLFYATNAGYTGICLRILESQDYKIPESYD